MKAGSCLSELELECCLLKTVSSALLGWRLVLLLFGTETGLRLKKVWKCFSSLDLVVSKLLHIMLYILCNFLFECLKYNISKLQVDVYFTSLFLFYCLSSYLCHGTIHVVSSCNYDKCIPVVLVFFIDEVVQLPNICMCVCSTWKCVWWCGSSLYDSNANNTEMGHNALLVIG